MDDERSQNVGDQKERLTIATLQPARSREDEPEVLSSQQHMQQTHDQGVKRDEEDSNEMTIARRTRSRVSVDDFVFVDNLDFPDVDRGLYQSADSEGDTEYKDFCRHLYGSQTESSLLDANTDDNDPPYIFNDHIFSPGWRFDLDEELQQQEEEQQQQAASYQGTDNNLTTSHVVACESSNLNNNTCDYNNLDVDSDDRAHRIDLCASFTDQNLAVSSLSTAPGFKSPNKHGKRKIDIFNEPEFKRTLDQQLRQHIQLLTQTYLLTKNTTNMQGEANEAKGYLTAYMKIFKNKSKPSNLLPAIELVNSFGQSKDVKSYVRLSWRHLPIPDTVKTILDTRREIFMYTDLMPEVAFSMLPEKLVAKKAKIIFTPNEEKLLAYALNEFKGETSQYAYIASLLMAAKTKMQINNHIKNIKRSPGNEDHPVKQFFATGQLPRVDLDADSELRRPWAPSEKSDDEDEAYEQGDHEPAKSVSPDAEGCERQQHERHEEPGHVLQPSDSEVVVRFEMDAKCNDEVIEQHFESRHHQQKPVTHNLGQQQQQQQQQQELSPDANCEDKSPPFQTTHDDIMNMDLDDLMAASTTISRTTNGYGNHNNGVSSGISSERNIKNLRLRSSMLDLMSKQFLISRDMGDLIVEEFITASSSKLSERDHLHLLKLLSDLMHKEAKKPDSAVVIYSEVVSFLEKIGAPIEIKDRMVLFLNLDQATKCGCALSYLHWMKFFEFVHLVELHHEGEAIEKKLARLIDALSKDDSHKVKLAAANLINKHPLLKREFDSLELEGKPHPSLFICDEDFDDVTEPMTIFHSREVPFNQDIAADSSLPELFHSENFDLKPTTDEINYASPSCPCTCHRQTCEGKPGQDSMVTANGGDQPTMELGQHCNKCNLKFMKGRMYLVNKIKPFLAEWSYLSTPPPSESSTSSPVNSNIQSVNQNNRPALSRAREHPTVESNQVEAQWTFEEDKEILEFCRAKAELNDENISFDTTIFEELVNKRRDSPADGSSRKKSARQIAERFNQLMEMYRVEGS